MKLTTTDAADFASDVLPIARAARDAIAIACCTRILAAARARRQADMTDRAMIDRMHDEYR